MRVMGECAYPAPMNRPLRITALVLLPLTMAGAVLTGCSRSDSPAADASASAVRIGALLEELFDWTVDADELLYLTLHVARLTGSAPR